MSWYRKTTPSSYPNTPPENFTDSGKHWRKYANAYIRTDDMQTLPNTNGRYTDNTKSWRRIKAMYRFNGSTWQRVFAKFAGQPYAYTQAAIRYSGYDGLDVGTYAMMGPGSESIAQGSTSTSYLWGKDAQDWQNIENLSSRSRTFVYGSTPIGESAAAVLNDEGNWDGDKLRNTQAYIEQYDGQYVWYRDRVNTTAGSTGTSFSQAVRIIKQYPVLNSFAFRTNDIISAGSKKYIDFSLKDEWYRSINRSNSYINWYILDTQYGTPSSSNLFGITQMSTITNSGTDGTTFTGEDYFDIPETFNNISTTGKWLYVELRCKNSGADSDLPAADAPKNDFVEYIVSQISGAVPIGTNATVTMSRENTSYSVSVASGNRGTWSNSPTSYRYQWYLQQQTVGSSYTWSPISGATSSTYDAVLYKPSDTSTTNRIVPVVWASNASGESNQGNALTNSGGVAIPSTAGGITIANPVTSTTAMIKYKLPTISTFTVTKGARKITHVSTFAADDPGVTYGTISWTGQATGSTTVNSSTNTYTYQPLAAGTYNFTLTVTNASTNALSGSATATQNSIAVDDFESYTFTFGKTFYVSTNGLIYLDVASGNQSPDASSGRVIKIFPKDLNQGSNGATGATGDGFLLKWSDSNDYVIRWDGYIDGQAGVSSYRLTYYVRFYKDQKYCDVYIQNKGANVGSPDDSPGFYFDATLLGAGLANPAQGSTFRIYLDGSTGSIRTDFSGELPVPADMVSAGPATASNVSSWPAADEGYTTITTATDVYTLPTFTIETVTSTGDSISVPYTTGGSYAKFDIDVKTTSYSGTSISGYPKTNQTTATPISISSLSSSTTYYIKIIPKNSKGQAGEEQKTSKATTAALGAFTIYAYNASVAPSVPSTPTITRQSATSNTLLIQWASSKPSNVASYNEIIWGEAFSSTYTTEASPYTSSVTLINQYSATATYNEPTGPYEDYWVIRDNGTTAKSFNVKVQAVGTNASRTAGIAWGESTNAGSYTVEYTISGSSTASNNKAYTSAVLASTARSLTVALGTAGGKVTINQVKAWSNTNGTGDLKYGSLQTGQSLEVTPTPATSAASSTASGDFIYYKAPVAPSTPSAPSVTYKSSRNSHTYTWDVSYTPATGVDSMDVMNQYYTSSSGTYTSSGYDSDPYNSSTANTYNGYIEVRNFAASKTMPLTDSDGYWDNSNSWMRARVRARNTTGSSGWSAWSEWA